MNIQEAELIEIINKDINRVTNNGIDNLKEKINDINHDIIHLELYSFAMTYLSKSSFIDSFKLEIIDDNGKVRIEKEDRDLYQGDIRGLIAQTLRNHKFINEVMQDLREKIFKQKILNISK